MRTKVEILRSLVMSRALRKPEILALELLLATGGKFPGIDIRPDFFKLPARIDKRRPPLRRLAKDHVVENTLGIGEKVKLELILLLELLVVTRRIFRCAEYAHVLTASLPRFSQVYPP